MCVMETRIETIKRLVKVHDFSSELLNHPIFKENWCIVQPHGCEMYLHIKRYDGCPTDFVTFFSIRVLDRIASEYGFTLMGVSYDNGSLFMNIFLGTL